MIAMDEEAEKRQYRRELFIKLLLMLRAAALRYLGVGEDEPKVDAEAAREIIDMLDLLQEKTAGNLSEPEEEMLKNLLTELRLAYVKTVGEGSGAS